VLLGFREESFHIFVCNLLQNMCSFVSISNIKFYLFSSTLNAFYFYVMHFMANVAREFLLVGAFMNIICLVSKNCGKWWCGLWDYIIDECKRWVFYVVPLCCFIWISLCGWNFNQNWFRQTLTWNIWTASKKKTANFIE